jgi:hypothetical protein
LSVQPQDLPQSDSVTKEEVQEFVAVDDRHGVTVGSLKSTIGDPDNSRA